MKRILVSVGLAALGASGVSAFAGVFSGLDTAKPWSVSLSLRGFYDDNINSVPNGRDSYGFEISPAVNLHLNPSPQTDFRAAYKYAADYYDKRPSGSADNWDQTHTFDLSLQHSFSERYTFSVSDSFVVGQQPDILEGSGALSTFQRISGNNIHNYGSIVFDAQITRLLGLEIGYANGYYNYEDRGAGIVYKNPPINSIISNVMPSRSGALDRLEHAVHLDTHWQVLPSTVLVVGYQYSETDYTGDEPVQANAAGTVLYMSDVRNTRSHYGYVGVNQSLRSDLMGSLRVGATYTDAYNDPNHATTVSPYVNLNFTYNYLPESYFQLGFTHDRTANDRIGIGGNRDSVVIDYESSTVYATLHHRITPKFFGTVTGSFQDSSLNAKGSPLNGKEDRFYMVSVDLEYRFTHCFSMHAGYNFDRLDSEVSGNYDRNRFYLGATVTY